MSHNQDTSVHATSDTLETLYTRVVDARAGFETMVEKAEPEFRPTAIAFLDLHTAHAREIAALVTRHGGTPDADGSLMSTVNRAVVSVRAMFDEIDDDVMSQIRDGEGHVLDAFDEAIRAEPHPDHARRLSEMRAELSDLLAASPSDN